jgi:hypothetical protein
MMIKEEDRLTWDQIFRHKVFGDAFKSYINLTKELEVNRMYTA